MTGLPVVHLLGRLTVVGAPVDARALGRPPGGAWVRAGHAALNHALGRAAEADVHELSGRVHLRAGAPASVSWWTPADGVRSADLAAGAELVLTGDPVAYLAPGRARRRPPLELGPVDVVAGPDLDVLPADCFRRLVETPWRVSPRSDRVGVCLDGPPLPTVAGRLPTAPMTLGAVELPPDGRPIVLGPDHPVTGGYPLVAVVPDYALDRLGAVARGASVWLRAVDRDTARARRAAWRAALADQGRPGDRDDTDPGPPRGPGSPV